MQGGCAINPNYDTPSCYEAKEVGKVVDESGVTVSTIDCNAVWLDTHSLVFILSNPIEKDGEYTVEIGSGCIISADGATNELLLFTYTVDSSIVEENLYYDVFPCEKQIKSETFPNVEFIFDEAIRLNSDEFVFISPTGEKLDVIATLSENTVILDCSEIRSSGKWTLCIPRGAFKSIETGAINAQSDIEWEFDSFSNIAAMPVYDVLSVSGNVILVKDCAKVMVYDVAGKRVKEQVGAGAMELPYGTYIVSLMNNAGVQYYKIQLLSH